MNVKQVGILAVLAVAAVGATSVALRSGPQGFATDRRGEAMFPGLTQRANDVASVTIRDFEKTFVVERRENGFFDRDSGYPVKPEAYRDLVAGASMLSFEETKTSDPARYGDLGLAEPGGAPETAGRDGTLHDARGGVLARVTVGNRDNTVGGARGGTFVRLPDQKQTWVARGEVRVPIPHAAWFEINLVNVQRDALESIHMSGGGLDEIHTVSAKQGDDIKLANAPEGREGDSSKLMRLSFMVDPISFQDVRKVTGEAKADARRMVVVSRKGYRITYTSIGELGDGWVRFKVEATSDAGKAEADDLRAKMEGFDFKLASHEVDMLGWGLKDVTNEPKS
jgi:hypothetical protein